MSKPQQPGLHRSRRAPTDRDSFEDPDLANEQDVKRKKRSAGSKDPVPEDNRPGHHPPKEQDKPEEMGGAGHGRSKDDKR